MKIPNRISCWLTVIPLLLAGCSEGENGLVDDDSETIRFATVTPLHKFDPHIVDGGPAFSTYLTLVYDGLLEGNPDSLWVQLPGLAREWHWVEDTTIEFKLVENARFSDGTLFDASVAKANIERMLRLKGPRIRTMTSIKDTEVVDPYTFRIHLHQHDPALLRSLAGPPGMMVSPAAFENDDLDLNPVGTGPWLYDQENSTIGEVHRFTARANYFKSANPSLADIEVHVLKNPRARLNALISGQVDIAILRSVEAKQAEDNGFGLANRKNRWFGMTILDRNGETVAELADPRVRQALGFAVDRQAIADAVFFGYAQAASQPMHRDAHEERELGHVPALENFYRYDPQHARELLKQAGVEGFSLVAPVLPDDSAPWEAVQYYLQKVGIDLEIELIEPGKSGAASRTKTYPINTITYPSFDPENRHRAIWGSNAIFNPFRVTDTHMDRLAEEARTSVDEVLRYRNFDEYFNTIVTQAWSVAYLQIDDLVAYDQDKLSGVRLSGYIDPVLRRISLNREPVSDD
jgi:peptide/nickel transport system substrate-binding protein